MQMNSSQNYVQAGDGPDYFSWSLLLFTSLAGLLASIWPMPIWAVWIRPEFAAMLVIYWVLFAPFRVGMLYGWSMGFMLDLLMGAVLCQHALGLTIVAYVVYLVHQRLRMFAMLQQAIAVFVIVSLYQLVKYWMLGFSGGGYASFALILPALASAICWPFTRLLLDRLRM